MSAEAYADGASIMIRLVNETISGVHDDREGESAHGGEHASYGTDTLIAIIIFLLLGTVLRSFIKTTEIPVPYTVCLLIVSFVWGFIYEGAKDLPEILSWTPLGAFEYLASGTDILIGIDPHLFLMVFIPPLIFESAFSVNYHTFTMVANQALILAGPGVLLSSLLTAGVSMLIFGWTFAQSLMFGAIISATDPVAVVALLRDLGASTKLATLIEGESLLNDGTAVVLYFIVQGVVMTGELPSFGAILWEFMFRAIGGVFWGIFAGWLVGHWLGRINDDFLIETSLTFAGAIWCFWGGLWMGVSDILAVVAFGLYLSKNETLISPRAQHALHYIWEWLAYVSNTLIFQLTGVIVAVWVKKSFDWNDLWKNLLLYFSLNVIRMIVFAALYPAISRLGYGISCQEAVIQVWGALRGAIGLAVAMITVLEVEIQAYGNEELELLAGKIMLHTCLIVVWTLIVNAVSMPYVVRYLEMDKLTEEGQVIFHQVIQRLQTEEKNLLSSMKCDHMYSATNWEQIKSILPDFEILKGNVFRKDNRKRTVVNLLAHSLTSASPHATKSASSSMQLPKSPAPRKSVFHVQKERNQTRNSEEINAEKLERYSDELAQYITMCDEQALMMEIRQRVLATVRASYWHQFHEGMISEEATRLLVESAEVAMDKGTLSAQWNHVSGYIIMPEYIAELHKRNIPVIKHILRWYLNERLNIGIQLCEAFIESYEKVRTMFETFPEFADLPMAQKVVDEGQEIDQVAKLELLKLKIRYSDIYRAIKTYQAATFMLNQQTKTVKNLHSAGVMEDKEYYKVLKFIEKHEFRARTLYRTAQINDTANLAMKVFQNLPWFSHLDEDLTEILFKKCNVKHYNEKVRLYHEGDDLQNVYIIVSGVLHFNINGHVVETRECGQFMGLIAILGSDTIHADIITGSQTVLIQIPQEEIELMCEDELCFQGMCNAAADVLINSYFHKSFHHETSVETNYRVQTGRLIEVDAASANVFIRSEALLIKGVGSQEISGKPLEGPGDDLICAPALLLPNMNGYEFYEGALIVELAPKDGLHGEHMELDDLRETEHKPEHIKDEDEGSDNENSRSQSQGLHVSIAKPLVSFATDGQEPTDHVKKTKQLMRRHTKSMMHFVKRPHQPHGCHKSLLRGSFLNEPRQSGFAAANLHPVSVPISAAKDKQSVISSNMFKSTRTYAKYGKVDVQDVILESDVETFSEGTDMSASGPRAVKFEGAPASKRLEGSQRICLEDSDKSGIMHTITTLKSKAKAMKAQRKGSKI